MKNRNVELLAPVGSFESLRGVINAGADAVYLGGEKFSARAFAGNLSQEEILKGMDQLHLKNKKMYLAVNTLVKEAELESLREFLIPYYENGLDGVIIQDVGVLNLIRREFPNLSLHGSTQMAVTGVYGAEYLKSQGLERIVPARELTLEEIKNIKAKTGMEVEVFIHGAMCYSYSGQCLFSSVLGGRSGNRGRCAQPCRLPYQVTEEKHSKKIINSEKEEYILSLKDLNAISELPNLLDAGVDSLKIEGRMKKPEYAAGVVSIYRKYLDILLEKGSQNYKVKKEDLDYLMALGNRGGVSAGYLKDHNKKSMITFDKPNYESGGDEFFQKVRSEFLGEDKKLKINGILKISVGETVKLILNGYGQEVTVEGEVVQEASKQPATIEKIEKQIRKTGNTEVSFENLEIDMTGNCFLSIQGLNQLRRDAITELINNMLQEKRRVYQMSEFHKELVESKSIIKKREKNKSITGQSAIDYRVCCLVSSQEQWKMILEYKMVNRIYIESSLLTEMEDKEAGFLIEKSLENQLEFYIALPYICRENISDNKDIIENLFIHKPLGFLVRNFEEMEILHEISEEKEHLKVDIVLDAGLYTWNEEAEDFWKKQGVESLTVPFELNRKELFNRRLEHEELIIYGHLPLMLSSQCIHKTFKGCEKYQSKENRDSVKRKENDNYLYLKDRYKKEFPVKHICENCYNILFNCQPMVLDNRKEISEIEPKSIRLNFTMEDKDTVKKVLDWYLNKKDSQNSGEKEKLFTEYTKGHLNRGVE